MLASKNEKAARPDVVFRTLHNNNLKEPGACDAGFEFLKQGNVALPRYEFEIKVVDAELFC
jgi:hypothetical protein